MKNATFILNEDVSCGKHFSDRYEKFHQLAQTIATKTKEDYLYHFHDVHNLTSDLLKAIVDDDDVYVWMDGTLFSMDEFLTPGNSRRFVPYRKYLQIPSLRRIRLKHCNLSTVPKGAHKTKPPKKRANFKLCFGFK